MRSEALTVDAYLESLPSDRQGAISTVRETILQHLPEGYEEAMNWGMICYQVPLAKFSKTYNGQPLMLAALASQKRHMAVYLTGIYMDEETRVNFEERYRETGKKLNAGKSCVRFTKLSNLPIELIGEVIARFPVDEFIEQSEAARKG